MAPRHDAPGCPWKGVNLGGWLLLEPGPSYPLFEKHVSPEDKAPGRCEWDLMKILRTTQGKKGAAEAIQRHRETHITKADFERIRACGMNAVRLPFGYWVVLGPSANELYAGPGLEHIDRAVQWAEECGLQVVLDLHGCPGGESGEAPCGRRQRPHGTWHWKQWRFGQSLEALRVVAQRYRARGCVTGMAVCNEPSNKVPLSTLCRYYDRAVDVIRDAGMSANSVAVVLPVFQRPEDIVIDKWHTVTKGRHKNVCFDVHWYHCFENEFHGKTFAQQLRKVEENAKLLREYPLVVGEWSLALGCAAWSTCGQMPDLDVYRLFGRAQVEAFKEASHGSFFWNWTEAADSIEWNFQAAHHQGLLSGPPSQLPRWQGLGEDPLEEILHPSPNEPQIFWGEAVYLRVFHGRYVDVEGSQVSARWPDKGKWQELTFCPPAAPGSRLQTTARRDVQCGDAVRLRTRSGRYLSVDDNGVVSAVAARLADSNSMEFIVHAAGATPLKHRAIIYLEHQASGLLLDADEDEECVAARWTDRGEWQQFAVEKMQASDALAPVTPKKHNRVLTAREEEDRRALAVPTPPQKRKSAKMLGEQAAMPGTTAMHAAAAKLLGQLETPKKRRTWKLSMRGKESLEVAFSKVLTVR